MRTDALLSRFGYCSRKDAPAWIKAGRVVQDGSAITAARQNADPARTLVDGAPVPFPNGLYAAFHKPLGCTCSHKEEGALIYDLLPPEWLRRNPPVNSVGRLDKETSGLLLLTDDGAFEHAMTSPRRHVPKVYELTTSAPIPEDAVVLFAAGTLLLNGETTPCKPAELIITAPCAARLTLHEGRYHQVRRMLAAAGAPVLTLQRVQIGPLRLADLNLQPGEWCAFNPAIFSQQA
ncbi:MAG: pseudouridine synthase [Akkermansia sp.]|nr:pseudouridine synthase [Akkermansia sp.]